MPVYLDDKSLGENLCPTGRNMVNWRYPYREDPFSIGAGCFFRAIAGLPSGTKRAQLLTDFMDHAYMDQDLTKQIHSLPASRRQRVFRLRRLIAEGSYETAEKLELAVSRMFDRLEDELASTSSPQS